MTKLLLYINNIIKLTRFQNYVPLKQKKRGAQPLLLQSSYSYFTKRDFTSQAAPITPASLPNVAIAIFVDFLTLSKAYFSK